jgi:hypothetical protein
MRGKMDRQTRFAQSFRWVGLSVESRSPAELFSGMKAGHALITILFTLGACILASCSNLDTYGIRQSARRFRGRGGPSVSGSGCILRLRGGNIDDTDLNAKAPVALTEEEEAMYAKKLSSQQQESVEGGDSKRKEDALDELRKHLSEVDANPTAYVPCTRKECARFIKTASMEQQTSTCRCKVNTAAAECHVHGRACLRTCHLIRNIHTAIGGVLRRGHSV